MVRYLVVGAGAAGISAAQAIRENDRHAEIVILSDEADGFYSRPGLAYLLTNEIPEKMLYPFSKADIKRLDIKFLHARAEKIHAQEHRLETAGGKILSYDRLLIATGAKAALPSLPGIELDGVVKLDNIVDARKIINRSRKASQAVVVGGGITAIELVEGLRAQGVRTHYLLRKDRYWGNVLDETESKIVLSRLKKEGVRVHFNAEVSHLKGNKGRLSMLVLAGGEEIKASIAAFAIGIRPHLELARTSGIACDRGILVNEFLETNQEDIYAAGDVAQVFDPQLGVAVLDSLWWPAREQGRTAGLNMSGQPKAYRKAVPYNVTRLAGLTTTIIGEVGGGLDEDLFGIARGDSETFRGVPDAIASQSNFDVNRVRLMVGVNHLHGALIMGDQTLSPFLQEMITLKADIALIREQLLKPKAPLADIIIQFWTPRRQEYAARRA